MITNTVLIWLPVCEVGVDFLKRFGIMLKMPGVGVGLLVFFGLEVLMAFGVEPYVPGVRATLAFLLGLLAITTQITAIIMIRAATNHNKLDDFGLLIRFSPFYVKCRLLF